MRIKERKLMKDGQEQKLKLGHKRLQPKSGLGYLEPNDDGSPHLIADVHCDGSRTVFIGFSASFEESWVTTLP